MIIDMTKCVSANIQFAVGPTLINQHQLWPTRKSTNNIAPDRKVKSLQYVTFHFISLLQVLTTLSVTTAPAERTFSMLCRLKT